MAYRLTYEIVDNDGDKAHTGFWLDEGLTLAQYQEYAELRALLVNPFILGAWNSNATLGAMVDISGLTGNVAGADSDVEQISAFALQDAAGNPVKVNIPGTVETQIAVGSDALDITDTAVAALIAAFEDGIDIGGSVIIQPSTIASADITTLTYARAETRNSGKRR